MNLIQPLSLSASHGAIPVISPDLTEPHAGRESLRDRCEALLLFAAFSLLSLFISPIDMIEGE